MIAGARGLIGGAFNGQPWHDLWEQMPSSDPNALNSVFSNSGIGVGFSMTVLISFVSVWSGRKKGFLLKKFSQRSVKGSLTC